MDIGQMMSVMQQMPAGQDVVPTGDATMPEQQSSAFAGLLKGLTVMQKTQGSVVGSISSLNLPVSEPVLDMPKEVVSALMAEPGENAGLVMTTKPVGDNATPGDNTTPDGPEQSSIVDSSPQNATLETVGAQLVLAMAQLHGRMPEAAVESACQTMDSQKIYQQENFAAVSPGIAAVSEVISTSLQERSVESMGSKALTSMGEEPHVEKEVSAVQAVVTPEAAAAVIVKNGPDITQVVKGDAPMHPIRQSKSDVAVLEKPESAPFTTTRGINTLQNDVAITERDTEVADRPVEVAKQVEAGFLILTDQVAKQTGGAVRQQVNHLPQQVVVSANLQEFPSKLNVARIVGVSDSPVVSPVGKMPAIEALAIGTENMVLQLGTSEPRETLSVLPATQVVTKPILVSEQQSDNQAVPVPLPGMPVSQETALKTRTAASLIPQVGTNPAALQSERDSARLEMREVQNTKSHEKLDMTKLAVEWSVSEKNTGSSEDETPNQGMNGNFQPNFIHHSIKAEGQMAVGNASGSASSETLKTVPQPEQFVQQVRDRLVSHETKPGTEQIVLRLSPEHLGELKVNLNMEGQRLKVEIVAENKMVRDSLMQHTDSLKESLSRQNIKMESFDVTTGGNSHADGGRNQNDWRELAQQRQQKSWLPEGGYRLPKEVVPAVTAYQAKSQHTMVDLHY